MKPIEINEQYETTHFDGETLLGSETKDEVWVGELKRGFRGDEGNGERCGDPIMGTLRKTVSDWFRSELRHRYSHGEPEREGGIVG